MTSKRVLNLKREALSELNPHELSSVHGGNAITVNGFTCPVKRCVIDPPQSYEAYATCTCCTASASC